MRTVLIALFAICFALLLHPDHGAAATGINQQVSFEGKVVTATGTNIPDGNYNMEFKIYQDGSSTGVGSTLKWTEDHLVSGGATSYVKVTAGTFQVNLGSLTAFTGIDWNQDTLWLSMQMGSTSSCTPAGNFLANCGGDGEMSPYIRFTSVPYALNAGQVGGLTASQLVQLTPGSQQSGSINVSGNIQTAANLLAGGYTSVTSGVAAFNGNVGIGTNTPGYKLDVSGNVNVNGGSGGYLRIQGAGGNSGYLSAPFGNTMLSQNLIYNGTNFIYDASSTGSLLDLASGGLTVLGALSGTSGATATTSNLLVLDASGNETISGALTVSGTGVSNFSGNLATTVNQAGSTVVGVNNTSTGSNASAFFQSAVSSGVGLFGASGSGYTAVALLTNRTFVYSGTSAGITLDTGAATPIVFGINNSEVGRFDGNGNFGVGTSGTPASALSVGGTTGNFQVNTSGTVVAGTWTGSTVGAQYGGTGQGSYAVGDLLYASSTSALSRLAAVATGSCLISQGTTTAPIWGSCTTLTATNGLNIASNQVGLGGTLANSATSLTSAGVNSQLKVVSGAFNPAVDQFVIDNTNGGSNTGVVTAGVNGLYINYKGGAAAVESSAQRIDLQPGTTSGSTWSGIRVFQNATGPATGVTSNGAKFEGPTTGGAGTYNAVNLNNIGAVASGGIVRGINITGTNSNAAGTVRGIQLNNITGGGASEIGIDLGTGWDNLLTYNNGATVIINGSGQLNLGQVTGTLAATTGGTGQSSYAVGDLLYASTTTALSKLAAVAIGSCLISAGVNTAPTWGACGASNANTALSNLASVAINTSLLPGTTNSIDLGSATKTFQNAYIGTSVLTPTLDTPSGTTTLNIGTTNATAGINLNQNTAITGQLGITSPTNATALTVTGASITLLTVDTSSNRVSVGTATPCIGRFCVNQGVSGAVGSGTYVNAYNLETVTATSGTATLIGQEVIMKDTSTAIGVTDQALLVDVGSASTNTAAIYQGLTVKLPTVGSSSSYFANYLNGATSEYKVDNVGDVTQAGTLTVGSTQVFDNTGILQNATLSGTYSNLTGVGIVTIGTWHAAIIAAQYGGTGVNGSSAANGTLLIGNGSGYTLAALTQGSNITVTNGSGTITLATSATPSFTTVNGLTLTAQADGFTLAGGTTSRTLTLTGANVTIGSTIQPTAAGSLTLESNGANTLTVDTGGASTLALGNGNATTVNVGMTTGATAQTVNISTGNGGNTVNIATGSGANIVNIGSSGDTTTLSGGATSEFLNANGATFQSSTNSTTAFQVQNAAGIPIFLVDTSTSLSGNYLANGGFELGTTTPTGWAAAGTPTTFLRNTTAPNHYGGIASLNIVTTATANQGATTTSFNSAPPLGTYTLSFYALQTSGTAMTAAQFQVSVNGAAAVACTAGVTLNSSGFQRVICPVTAGATITSISIQQSAGAAAVHTLYLDGVQLVAGTSPTPATSGAIQLRGAIDSPVVFQALSNSTTAFQIQNTAGTSNLFVADTLNSQIHIGSTNSTLEPLVVNNALTVTSGEHFLAGLSTGNTGGGNADLELGYRADGTNVTSVLLRAGNGKSITFGTTTTNQAVTILDNGNTSIGSTTANTVNGSLLELNNYNAAVHTEPTEVDGAMYYNSTLGQFRCGVLGTWESCGGLTISNTSSTACTISTSSTSCVPSNYFVSGTPTIPANYCIAGRAIHVIVNGIYSQTVTAQTMTISIKLGATIVGAAATLTTSATASITNAPWGVDFWITCDSTTTVTGEGTARAFSTATAFNLAGMTGTTTTTVTNTSAQTISPYLNYAATTGNTATIEQFIVQGM